MVADVVVEVVLTLQEEGTVMAAEVDLFVEIVVDRTAETVAEMAAAAAAIVVVEATVVAHTAAAVVEAAVVGVVDQVVLKVQLTSLSIQATSTNMKQDASTILVTQPSHIMQAACLLPATQSATLKTLSRRAWLLVTFQLSLKPITCQFVLAMELVASR